MFDNLCFSIKISILYARHLNLSFICPSHTAHDILFVIYFYNFQIYRIVKNFVSSALSPARRNYMSKIYLALVF